MSKSTNVMVDLEDRDPNNLSNHLQVSWDEVIGEPDNLRSPECVWRLSQQCFQHSLNICYILLSVLLAPFTAFCLGCNFACLTFQHIWCCVPGLRIWRITCAVVKNFCTSCVSAVVVPCTEALGLFWSNIRIKTQSLPGQIGTERSDNTLLI